MIKKIFNKIILAISMISFFLPCEGDANLDDLTNIQDIVLIVSHVVSTSELVDDAFDNSDINNDDFIDVVDIVSIINIILIGDFECNDTHLDLSLEWEFSEDLSYFDSEELYNIIDNQISSLSHINGIIVIHEGKIVDEQYFNGSSINDVYNIWSVTKSFTSTLMGQAIDQELIEEPTTTLDNFLPNYGQAYLQSVTLHNLLSMSSGYVDGFMYPYFVDATTEQLEWMAYSFPGWFFYNNSACHLNSHILYYGTGMTPKEFANINLFPYLGINDPFWLDGYNNINDGSASLYLNLREMVKLGQLYIQDGYSGDIQILSSEWINQATSHQIDTGSSTLAGYGYLWWIPERGYLAIGYGGQFIAVIPELELIIGTHSAIPSTEVYQMQLLNYIYNDIVPIFEED